jgi:chemotaxis regulatin CheY-phosphate phosphatase CheZ
LSRLKVGGLIVFNRMPMDNLPPIIAFELGVGEFRIVTPEAVYQIRVCPDLVEATRPGEAPGEAPVGAGRQPGAANTFFQELSQELFDKVGRLARQLSVSVEELPADMPTSTLDDTGQQLESAKGQLEEIIDLTEKASMSIMDSADEIQDNLTQLRNKMDILKGLEFMAEAAGAAGQDTPPPAGAADSALLEKLAEINALLDRLIPAGPGEAAPPAAPTPPAGEKVTVVHFDVEVVFQTLYELCTNESVKERIRLMREAQSNSFDGLDIAAKLTELSAGVTVDDGFYSFPIPAVLKILYGATASEEYRAVLKKMNQTASSIFLDSVLPVEGEIMEIEAGGEALSEVAPAAPAEPVPAGPVPAELRTLRGLTAELDALARSGSGPAAPAGGGDGLYTHILTQDRDALVQIVSQANELIQKTGRHLTRILETLSFQDLSGQRIKKVVALMGDIQAQLLSILVSVNTKIKVHEASKDQEADPEKAEKMAQDEVDRALEKLMVAGPSDMLGPGAENRLNQNAVNDLLANLGF